MVAALLALALLLNLAGCSVRYDRLPDPRPGVAVYRVEILWGARIETVEGRR